MLHWSKGSSISFPLLPGRPNVCVICFSIVICSNRNQCGLFLRHQVRQRGLRPRLFCSLPQKWVSETWRPTLDWRNWMITSKMPAMLTAICRHKQIQRQLINWKEHLQLQSSPMSPVGKLLHDLFGICRQPSTIKSKFGRLLFILNLIKSWFEHEANPVALFCGNK